MNRIPSHILDTVGDYYLRTESLKKTADFIQFSEAKTRKILISLGVIESDIALYCQDHTPEQAMKYFGVNRSTVNNWLPYTRGAYDGKSVTTRRRKGE